MRAHPRLIAALKRRVAHYWPRLRLRTIIFGTLLLVAALPGFSAIFLRVYENALVRRTEAELVAQGAALSASAALLWPSDGRAAAQPRSTPRPPSWASDTTQRGRESAFGPTYEQRPTEVDLSIAPIFAERPRAVAAAAMPDPVAQWVADRLRPAIAETQIATLASIRITDAHGVLLNGEQRGRSLAAIPELVTALGGAPVTILRENSRSAHFTPMEWFSRASNLRLHHARPIRVNGRIVGVMLVSRTPPPLLSGMIEDAGKISFGVIAILGALLLLTAVLARAIVRPIETLSRATRNVAAGRTHIPGDPSLKVVEIETLYADFRRMADAIAQRSKYLRDFAASLSHEFKTPLSGITGGIELLEDHGADMSADDRARFLNNMRGDADRLNRLLGRLMDLARADMRVADGGARCHASDVLASIADGLRRPGVVIAVDIADDITPAVDVDTLATIGTILVENSIQAGASKIAISAAVAQGHAMLSFVDNGPGIAPADVPRVFDTFFTSKREAGGTGLGLTIARSLSEASGGALVLDAAGDRCRFTLRLPLAGGAGLHP